MIGTLACSVEQIDWISHNLFKVLDTLQILADRDNSTAAWEQTLLAKLCAIRSDLSFLYNRRYYIQRSNHFKLATILPAQSTFSLDNSSPSSLKQTEI